MFTQVRRREELRSFLLSAFEGDFSVLNPIRDLLEERDSFVKFGNGQQVFIETATKFWLGKVESCDVDEVVLSGASWVADTGYLSDFIKDGKISESEYVGDLKLAQNNLYAAMPWNHELPTKTIGR